MQLPKEFLEALQEVQDFGAKKYGEDGLEPNWLEANAPKTDHKSNHDSMFHHLALSFGKERLDAESQLDHLQHLAYRALMQVTRMRRSIGHVKDFIPQKIFLNEYEFKNFEDNLTRYTEPTPEFRNLLTENQAHIGTFIGDYGYSDTEIRWWDFDDSKRSWKGRNFKNPQLVAELVRDDETNYSPLLDDNHLRIDMVQLVHSPEGRMREARNNLQGCRCKSKTPLAQKSRDGANPSE